MSGGELWDKYIPKFNEVDGEMHIYFKPIKYEETEKELEKIKIDNEIMKKVVADFVIEDKKKDKIYMLKKDNIISLGNYIKYDSEEKKFINSENENNTFNIKDKEIFLTIMDALILSDNKILKIDELADYKIIEDSYRKGRKGKFKGKKWERTEYFQSKSKNIVDTVHRKLKISTRYNFISFRGGFIELNFTD